MAECASRLALKPRGAGASVCVGGRVEADSPPLLVSLSRLPTPFFFRTPSFSLGGESQVDSLAGLLITPCLRQHRFIEMIKAVWRAIMTTGSDAGGRGGEGREGGRGEVCLATGSAADN